MCDSQRFQYVSFVWSGFVPDVMPPMIETPRKIIGKSMQLGKQMHATSPLEAPKLPMKVANAYALPCRSLNDKDFPDSASV